MTNLTGKHIVVTRARHQAAALCAALEARGATALALATVAIRHDEPTPELDAALGRLTSYDWVIFTSANTAESVCARAAALGVPLETWLADGLSVAAIGEATANALRERGVPVRAVAANATPTGIVAALGNANMARVLLPQSDIARPELSRTLQSHGAIPHCVTAYRTLPQQPPAAALAEALASADAFTFASPSAVTGLALGLAASNTRTIECGIASIGPVTSDALRKAGFVVDVEANDASVAGLVRALEEYFSASATA